MKSTKREIRSTKQIQNSNEKNSKCFGFRILDLGFVSDFDIRISDFLKHLFRISIFGFRAFSFLLDLLFPPPPLLRELLRMDAAELSERVERAGTRAGKNIISLFSYQDPLVRRAVWELKYRGNKKVAALLAAALYDELLGFLEEYAPLTNFTEPLVIPIPLSRKRERERGFNQCVLLIDELEKLDGGHNFSVSETALRKIKDTQSQTKADSRAKRLENLKDCFAVDRALVEGRNTILIDDVATTGATLTEARRTLRRAGARKVIAFTIAH